MLVVLVAIMGYRAWQASRVSPEERERQRRAMLVAHGKMGDATLTEVREDHVFYAYLVRGVEYTASQDVSLLKQYMPPDLSLAGRGVGAVRPEESGELDRAGGAVDGAARRSSRRSTGRPRPGLGASTNAD